MTRRAAASDAERGIEKGIAMLEHKGARVSLKAGRVPDRRSLMLSGIRRPKAVSTNGIAVGLRRLVCTEHDVELDGSAPPQLHRWDRNEFPGYDDVTLLDA